MVIMANIDYVMIAVLVKNIELHSDLITGLEFILNAANRFPEIFFPPLLAHSDDQENNSNEEWQKMLKTTPYGIQKLNFLHFLQLTLVLCCVKMV